MSAPSVDSIIKMVDQLSVADRVILISSLSNLPHTTRDMESFVTDERFSKGRVCPRCGCTHVVRNGHRPDGVQRYLCKDCDESFVATSNTIVEGTRKSLDIWKRYIGCMMRGLSVRQAAEECGIHRNTSFFWRHKVLDALRVMMSGQTLDGIVEMDETFFAVSYKGNHSKGGFTMLRPSHKRGKQVHKRGISNEQVCVPCALSRAGLAFAKAAKLGRATAKSIEATFCGMIGKGATLVTDKHNAYVRLANESGHELVQLKGNESRKGIYNVQCVNSYHGSPKKFMARFDGVATKYLDNYLAWHAFMSWGKDLSDDKAATLTRYALSAPMTVRCKEIAQRGALPFAA